MTREPNRPRYTLERRGAGYDGVSEAWLRDGNTILGEVTSRDHLDAIEHILALANATEQSKDSPTREQAQIEACNRYSTGLYPSENKQFDAFVAGATWAARPTEQANGDAWPALGDKMIRKLEAIRKEIDGPFGLSMGSRLASHIREILDAE